MTRAARLGLGVALGAAALAGCSSIELLAPGIAFLDIRGPLPARVAVGSSVTLQATALDARADTVAATFEWFTPDTAAVFVNRTSGVVTGRVANSSARIQARSGELASPFFTLTVVAAVAP